MFNRQKKFRMEQLEARQMMAGDVAAFVNAAGDLFINEAAGQGGQNNTVMVSTLANGMVRVESPSLINGQNGPQDFAVTGNVYINLGDGSDHVEFSADLTQPGPPSFTTLVDINVAGNPGSTNDNDHVIIDGAVVQGLMQVTTGVGNDTVEVINPSVTGDGIAIFTGAGKDFVDVQMNHLNLNPLDGLYIQTYDSLSETDADQVNIEGNYDIHYIDSIRVKLGGGNDLLHLDGIDAGVIDIDAGTGNDTATIRNVYADELMARMGSGSDSLDLYNVNAYMLSLLGDFGFNDRLTKNAVTSNSLTQTGWELVNGRPVLPRDDYIPVGTVNRPIIRL